MDEAVLVQADIHKCAKRGKIGHQAGQFHSRLEVLYIVDIIRKGELLRGLTRVPAGFLELLDNIVNSGQAKVLFYVILRLDLLAQCCISHQFPGAHAVPSGAPPGW